jgi:hypothetical protein
VASFKPVEFRPQGYRRSRFHLPRWLVLLLTGIIIGAGAVILVQEKYLPPRLSIDESSRLRQSFDQADAERKRLAAALESTTAQLRTALSEKGSLSTELGDSRQSNERLRAQLTSLVQVLPPDPRGSAIEIRSANLANSSGTLAYEVLVSRAKTNTPPFSGILQFVVSGRSARGTDSTVALAPVTIALDVFEHLRGSVPLPEGFVAEQATIRVLDRPEGKLFGSRVMKVR